MDSETLKEEVFAIEREQNRLREIKHWSKEMRRCSGLPVSVLSKPCPCCGAWAKKKHTCLHNLCEKPCTREDEWDEDGPDAKIVYSENFNMSMEDLESHQLNQKMPLFDCNVRKKYLKLC